MEDPKKITYFAETDARSQNVPFGIKAVDRLKHLYVIGKTGMGKSTLLENLAAQDIRDGNGMAFIDPHGKTADLLLEYVPEERIKDVLYIAPFDMEFPVSFNIMEDIGYDKRHLVVSGLMGTFKKIWVDVWSARMEYILANTLLALLEYPDSTLLSVNKMLSDKAYRKKVVENIQDTSVKSFWIDEFANYTERMAAESIPAIQNKVGQFTSNPLIRNIIGQPQSSFDIRKMMDEKKIIIINLSKGRIGEQNANLLGSLLITKIYLSAMSRADVHEEELKKLPSFFLYVDEFQSFANESFADILSEARKYKLSLNIAHQYIEQMSDEVRAAVFGNVGTMITFRVGSYDAEVLEKEFAPTFTAEDIVNLGFTQIYLRLMIDGVGSSPFSARTLPPLEKSGENNFAKIVESSREQFATPRVEVEEEVKRLVEMGRVEKPAPNNNNKNNSSNKKPGENNFNKNGNNPPSQGGNGNFNNTNTQNNNSSPNPISPAQNESNPSNNIPPAQNNGNSNFSNQKNNFNKEAKQENKKRPVIDAKALEEINSFMGVKKEIDNAPKEISLSSLEKRPESKLPYKGPTPEHKDELRNILSQVLSTSPNGGNNQDGNNKQEEKKDEFAPIVRVEGIKKSPPKTEEPVTPSYVKGVNADRLSYLTDDEPVASMPKKPAPIENNPIVEVVLPESSTPTIEKPPAQSIPFSNQTQIPEKPPVQSNPTPVPTPAPEVRQEPIQNNIHIPQEIPEKELRSILGSK